MTGWNFSLRSGCDMTIRPQRNRIAATVHLDQLQAHVRDLTNPLQERPMTA